MKYPGFFRARYRRKVDKEAMRMADGNVVPMADWLSGRARQLMEAADRCERYGRWRAADQYRQRATGYLLRMLTHYQPDDDPSFLE